MLVSNTNYYFLLLKNRDLKGRLALFDIIYFQVIGRSHAIGKDLIAYAHEELYNPDAPECSIIDDQNFSEENDQVRMLAEP